MKTRIFSSTIHKDILIFIKFKNDRFIEKIKWYLRNSRTKKL